jgi:POT family proton-dependent oligopeptide transporter
MGAAGPRRKRACRGGRCVEHSGAMTPAAPRDLFGQPRGLAYLFGTELWDRISFHGMQALLVLYMVGQLLLPGHVEKIVGFPALRSGIEAVTGPLSVQALASQIFGLYVGLVYFMPVFGGVIGDRVLGRRRTVALGAVLMTAGHFCMAFDASFLAAMALLIAGAGCLRGNLVSQVGDLYGPGDPRRDAGFQIYFTGINLGAFIAPVVCGLLGQVYGWHIAFGFAGVGMLIGLVVFLAGARYLPPDLPRTARGARAPLTRAERRVIAVLLLLLPVLTTFWIAQSQVWNVYNLWVRDHIDLVIAGWTMPVPWLQAIDGLAPVVLLAPTLALWRWQRSRGGEPDDLAKMAIGCLIFAAGTAWLAAAPLVAEPGGRAPLLWAIGFHLLSNEGWLFFVPIALAVWSRAAPAKVNGTMVGVYYLSTFFGSTISGRIGGLYEVWSPTRFWLLHAGIVAGGGVVLWTLGPALRRELAPGHVVAGSGHLDLKGGEVVA